MSEGNDVKTVLIIGAFGSLSLLAFVSALFGVLGAVAQAIALVYGLGVVSFCVGFVMLANWSRAETFSRREALSAGREDHPLVGGVDRNTDRLRSNLQTRQRDEDSYVERYTQRRCSLEDVLLAKANRLQAEIELIRHEKRPKSWAEVCTEYHSCKP